MDTVFNGEYLEGWGTDEVIDKIEVEIEKVTLDIREQVLLVDFNIFLDISFSIQTINPAYEKGDTGDGFLNESSSTKLQIQGNISYNLSKEELFDYTELEIEFI